MAKRKFTAHLRDHSSSLCNSNRNRPRSGIPFDLHQPLDDVYGESRSRILDEGKRSSRLRSKRPTRLEADQLEDGFRLMKNISPADYTDSKFISCETNPSESLLKIVKLHEVKEVLSYIIIKRRSM